MPGADDTVPPTTTLRSGARMLTEMKLTPFVVHGLGKFSGYDSLVGEGSGRQAAQGRMRSVIVVVAPPVLDALTGISQRQEPRSVQAFRS